MTGAQTSVVQSRRSRKIGYLGEVAGKADAFLVDQFGTLHDGYEPYAGAVDALEALRSLGKRVIVLSNSGRRAKFNEERLHSLGVPSSCYDASVTSGEAAWEALRSNPPPPLQTRCRVLSTTAEPIPGSLDGFDVDWVDSADCADLLLIGGYPMDSVYPEAILRRLVPALERDIIAVCTNPDRWRLTPEGLRPGAGAIGEAYERAGGRVLWFGKPHLAIFEAALAKVSKIPRKRVLVIGDSIEHDIAGGSRAGCQTLLVRTGVMAQATAQVLHAEIQRWHCRPDYMLKVSTVVREESGLCRILCG